jgi:hypothetical protein
MNSAINKKEHYVVIPLLPIEQIEPFSKWLHGQTVPVIEEEGEYANKCAWLWDYKKWHEAWSTGQVAIILD